jgi:hypothetical protein
MTTWIEDRRFTAWIAAAVAINAVAFLMAHLVQRPAVAFGCAFDVAITVPALYYWMVVRAGLLPAASMLPLCLLALLRATFLAPGVAWTRPVLGASAEIAVVSYLAIRVRRGLAAAGAESDILERLTLAARELVRSPAVAAVLAGEIAAAWYALGPWGRKPHAPAGTRPFSIHRETLTGALLWTLAALSLVETAVVHVVVRRWHPSLAWALTLVSLYGVMALRPILLSEDELLIRCGILWTLRVPLDQIAVVRRGTHDGFHLPPASEPKVVIEFREPQVAHAVMHLKRRVGSVGLAVDDVAGFELALLLPAKTGDRPRNTGKRRQ